MINLDEDALICDFAETYHIYDYRALPLKYVAVLACGLRDNSRIKLKMADIRIDTKEMLLATIADRLSVRIWQSSEDGQKGRNMPKSMLDSLLNVKRDNSNVTSFDTVDDFIEAWNNG